MDLTFAGEGLKLVVAALLGALLSGWVTYAVERGLRERELFAKRKALIGALRTELTAIPRKYVEPVGASAGAMLFRDTIQLVTPSLLVDGSVLDYEHNAHLIAALLNLQVMVNRHNGIVQTVQLVQASLLSQGVTGNRLVSNDNLYAAIKPRFDDVLAALSRLDGALFDHERAELSRRPRRMLPIGAMIFAGLCVVAAVWSLSVR